MEDNGGCQADFIDELRRLGERWLAAPDGHWAEMVALALIIKSYENPMPAVIVRLTKYKGGLVELRVWLAVAAGLFDDQIIRRLRGFPDRLTADPGSISQDFELPGGEALFQMEDRRDRNRTQR